MGVTKPIFSVPLFSTVSAIVKTNEYRVYIWQVSPQLSCGDTCQIWMWFRESNRYLCKIENFAYREISERSFSNPHPETQGITAVKSQTLTCIYHFESIVQWRWSRHQFSNVRYHGMPYLGTIMAPAFIPLWAAFDWGSSWECWNRVVDWLDLGISRYNQTCRTDQYSLHKRKLIK